MGDHCFMQITCRRQDQAEFEALGFYVESEPKPEAPLVELIDEEANYAHYDELPTSLPYFGYHSPGGNYGPCNLACNGRKYADVETGHDGQYVINWDDKTNRPARKSLLRIRTYLKVYAQARQALSLKPN